MGRRKHDRRQGNVVREGLVIKRMEGKDMLYKLKSTDGSKEIAAFVVEAEEMVEKYGWQDRTVTPYSWPEKVTKLISDIKDYDLCTNGSRDYLKLLANGLVDRLNAWERYENLPKVRVRSLLTGNEAELVEELAKEMIEAGVCVAI